MTAFASLDRIAAEVFGYADRSPAPIEPFPIAEGGSKGSKGSMGVRDGSLGVASDAGPGNGSTGVVSEEDRTAARAAALGVGGPLRTPFACLFACCDERASLRGPTPKGYWKYRCSCLGRDVGLAEVYGLLAYERVGLLLRDGRPRRLSEPECARWGDRLDADAGLLHREPRAVVPPEDASPSAVRVARGMGLLLGLRDPERWPADEPFVFARDFARAYCGLTDEEARYGVVALRRAGVLEPAGKSGRALLWRLAADASPASGGGAPPAEPPRPATGPGDEPKRLIDVLGSEDAIVAAFVREFDAVEVLL